MEDDKKKKLKLIQVSEENDKSSYTKYIKGVIDEKRYVAKDYQASNIEVWPSYFLSSKSFTEEELTKLKLKSYLNYTMFYLGPFITTSVFSMLFYPKAVYAVKKIFKFKSFYTINFVFFV